MRLVIIFFEVGLTALYLQVLMADEKSYDKAVSGKEGRTAGSGNSFDKNTQGTQEELKPLRLQNERKASRPSRPPKPSKPSRPPTYPRPSGHWRPHYGSSHRRRGGSAKIRIFSEIFKSPKLKFSGYSFIMLLVSAIV